MSISTRVTEIPARELVLTESIFNDFQIEDRYGMSLLDFYNAMILGKWTSGKRLIFEEITIERYQEYPQKETVVSRTPTLTEKHVEMPIRGVSGDYDGYTTPSRN